MYLPASPEGNTEGGENVLEIVRAIINILNSIGAGVIANYITPRICKRLGSGSAGTNKKH